VKPEINYKKKFEKIQTLGRLNNMLLTNGQRNQTGRYKDI